MAHKLGFSAVNTQFNRNKEDNSKIEEQLSLLQNNLIFGRVTDIILDDTYPNFQELLNLLNKKTTRQLNKAKQENLQMRKLIMIIILL